MTDAQLIDHHGGPARLAEKLGWKEAGAIQRIHNWRSRGIPAAVKLKYPTIFLPSGWPRRTPTKEAAHG
ncbi:MAG: hypothetical protein EON54_03800 [Alcaligenaceae bacterium]|nr:MAG: hypothetical protein EON54_03800 [Alcaligenaceae bacterium]